MITRRTLLSFVALGGLVASVRKRLLGPLPEREAMFWEEERETPRSEEPERKGESPSWV